MVSDPSRATKVLYVLYNALACKSLKIKGEPYTLLKLQHRTYVRAKTKGFFTLNFTILHICNPTLDPASFHASSVSAAAFLTWGKGKKINDEMNPCVASSIVRQ